MPFLEIDVDAEAELEALWEAHPQDAAVITQLLRLLAAEESELDKLVRTGFRSHTKPNFDIGLFQEAQDLGYNLYRIKYLNARQDYARFRVFLAYDRMEDGYYVLAISARSDDTYSTSSKGFQDLVHRYEQCGIPMLHGHG